MKNFYLRSMAVACAFGLAACGGGGGDLLLGISPIYGVTKDGLTISNNGGTPVAILHGTTSYVFTEHIGTDTAFDIKIVTQPPNATCTIVNGKGTTGAYSPTGIAINCIANPYNVSAQVSGLTAVAADASHLVVVNGALKYTIASGATDPFTYHFALADDGTKTTVGDGEAYGYVILTQPALQKCTLLNGGGIMGSADVSNLTITCVPAP